MTGRCAVRAARAGSLLTYVGLACAALMVPAAHATSAPSTSGTVNGFAYGEMQSDTVGATRCGANTDGEPSLHVSRANLVGLGSEEGVGSGSDYWRAQGAIGGSTSVSACGLTYAGQPNAVSHEGASGGD